MLFQTFSKNNATLIKQQNKETPNQTEVGTNEQY